ncbi:DUF4476 domain-containing protein [Rufibacter immobilis]|uniref:DUF4476 domain-containing protein n=1 Tax=Rufibacter immobilis TaxID=1348778 RepID=A0A3M9N3B0_9BACT|nr:DUF4476 domain-containing protein [Rufibacter immobilis]RNI32226.1 DUF4476 domain-containing protein [Rufibacter immobilis]
MKRLYFLGLCLCLLNPLLYGQARPEAALLVESQRGEYFQLNIGGRIINPTPASRVAVGDLPAGKHLLRIRVLGRGRRAQNITAQVVLERGYESVYVLTPTSHRSLGLVLRKAEDIPLENPLPPAEVSAQDICRHMMEERDVDRVIRFIREEDFDDRRLEIARGEIKLAGGLLTEDLYLLLKELNFDEQRVALAKFAYAYVCDRHRFSRVLDAFESSAGKREMQDFLYKR